MPCQAGCEDKVVWIRYRGKPFPLYPTEVHGVIVHMPAGPQAEELDRRFACVPTSPQGESPQGFVRLF